MTEQDKTVWCVHTQDDALFLQNNCIAIGWHEMGDLTKVGTTHDEFKSKVAEVYPDAKKGAIPVNAGMLYRFCYEMKVGDLVLFPSKSDRMINLGIIDGPYEYKAGEHYPNVRKVRWVRHRPRADFSQGLLYSMGGLMTVFSIRNYRDEIEKAYKPGHIVSSKPPILVTADAIVENTKDFILKELSHQLKGYDLEDFVANLLDAMGYRSKVSQHGGDSGIDIVAYKDELPPRILVQVKSIDGDVKEQTIMSLKGAMMPGDYGLFVTLSNYTKNAKRFLAANPIIRGINGSELVELILEYYEKLDEKYQDIIPLQKVYVPVVVPQEQEEEIEDTPPKFVDEPSVVHSSSGKSGSNQPSKHRPPVRFSECNIPVGAKLGFVSDPSVYVTVIEDGKVEYNGQVMSMTGVAKLVKNTDAAINGSKYFTYNGKCVYDIAMETQWKDFKYEA